MDGDQDAIARARTALADQDGRRSGAAGGGGAVGQGRTFMAGVAASTANGLC